MRKLLAPLAITALLLTGCGAEAGSEPTETVTVTAEPESSSSSGQSQAEWMEENPEAEVDNVGQGAGFDAAAGFGETVTFASGVEVTVEPVSLVPNNVDETMVETTDMVATFSITIKNGSSGRIDASIMSWPNVTYEGDPDVTVDSNAGLSALLSGDEQTGEFSRFIPGPGLVRVEIPAPDMVSPSAIFEGQVE